MRSLRTRRTSIDIAIVAAIVLFFFAGVFFESRRSSDDLNTLAPPAGAESSPVSPTAEVSQEPDGSAASATPVTGSTMATPVPSGVIRTPVGTPNPDAVGQPVFLDLQGIENESVVEASSVTLTGQTTPDALLSIDGQLVPVELDGSFEFVVELEPGPNFVEIVSSNLRGEETSRTLSVVSVQ